MTHAGTTMTSTFEELRSFLHESDKGQIFDSLIAVELGVETYETFWQAHVDMNENMSFEDLVVGFLVDIYDFIGEGADIDALVSQVAND